MLGPNSQNAALAEAFAAFLQSRLVDGENRKFFTPSDLVADPSLRECLSLVEDSLYTQSVMADVFSAYRKHLDLCDLDEKSKLRYWQVVNSFRKWLGKRRPDVSTAQEFLAYLREKGYRPRSVLLYYHALRLFLSFRGIQLNLKLRKPRELPPYHSQEEIEKLIEQAEIGLYHQKQWHKDRNKAMILTFAYSGIRKQSLLNLRVSDINFEKRLLFIRQDKGKKDRVIPLAQRIIEPLHSQCAGKKSSDLVFPGLNAASVYRIISKLSKACGLEGVHPHTLRHCFATRLVELGVNIRVIQELLGHADLSTTSIYLDVSPKHLQGAIDALDNDSNP